MASLRIVTNPRRWNFYLFYLFRYSFRVPGVELFDVDAGPQTNVGSGSEPTIEIQKCQKVNILKSVPDTE